MPSSNTVLLLLLHGECLKMLTLFGRLRASFIAELPNDSASAYALQGVTWSRGQALR